MREAVSYLERGNIYLLVGNLQLVTVVDCEGLTVETYAKQFLDKSKMPLRVAEEKVDSGTTDAEPIVKKLSLRDNSPNCASALKLPGIVPVKALEDMSNLRNVVSVPKVLGMVPVSKLLLNVMCSMDIS